MIFLIKLIVSDIDGTLIDEDLKISNKLLETAQRLRKENIFFTLATGRMFSSALPFAEKLGIDIPIITYNGALIQDTLQGKQLFSRKITSTASQLILQTCKANSWYVQCYIDDKLYVAEECEYAHQYSKLAGVPFYALGSAFYNLNTPQDKMLLIAEAAQISNIQAQLKTTAGNDICFTSSKSRFIECVHHDVNKGAAITKLANYLNIDLANVMAIGDSFNDVEMLKTAGLGIAMGNAPPPVKNIAQGITASNQEDGLALAIEKYVF